MKLYALPAILKAARHAKNYSQQHMCSLLCIEQTTYAKKENAKSPLTYNETVAIGELLEVSPLSFLVSTAFTMNMFNPSPKKIINPSTPLLQIATTLQHQMNELVLRIAEDDKLKNNRL